MNDKVVIAGTVKLRNTIKAKTNLHNVINGTPSWVVNTGGGGIVYPHYSGDYTVTPSTTEQVLETNGKVMDDDVTVNPIPSEYIIPAGTKTITQNGTHDVAQYESAVVDVQGGITPTGTKQISIAANGTVTEDVTNYASAEINVNVPASAVDTGTKSINSNGTHDVVGYANASVNVPNSYSQSDEGKVVSNGALVSQTSDTVTANDTYDTTLINSLTVNVSGGGGGAITLLNTVEVTEQVRAVNVDINDYSSLYDFIFIYIDAELTASDWLYYVMNGSSPSGGTYQSSMQNHKGICFIQIHPAPGNPANTVLAGVIGSNVLSVANRNGIPVSNVYVYTYTSTKYFKVGSKFSIYGGNYADM